MSELPTGAVGTAAAAAVPPPGMPNWATLLSMALTLITSFFTGGGTVSAEQEAALNAASPGLGSAFAAAVSATNGAATSIFEWKAKKTAWDFVAGDDGLIPTLWNTIKGNPLLVVGFAWVAYRLLTGSSLLPSFLSGRKKEDTYYDEGTYT